LDPQRQCETALENEQLRVMVGLWRLCFGTGRWLADLLTEGMTASGRLLPLAGPEQSLEAL